METALHLIGAVFTLVGGYTIARRLNRRGIIGFFIPEWLMKMRESQPQEKYQTYGHPFAPVPTLHEALPAPPVGHAWEILVESRKSDDLQLVCRLMDFSTGSVVSKAERSLINKRYGSGTWADHYDRWPGNKDAHKVLVDEMVDWATREKNAAEIRAYTGGEYMMKGA